jgi:hypothetical protein
MPSHSFLPFHQTHRLGNKINEMNEGNELSNAQMELVALLNRRLAERGRERVLATVVPYPRPVVSSVWLADQFDMLTPVQWTWVQRRLRCRLPELVAELGHWRLPAGLETVWDWRR